MAQNCAASFEGRQLVLTENDVVVHDLNQAQSIVDKTNRNWLFSNINNEYRFRCYVAPDYRNREMWICFPSSSALYPDMAMIWNWYENTTTVREIGFECPHMAYGKISVDNTVFDSDDGQFDAAEGTFAGEAPVSSLMMVNPTSIKLLRVDDSNTYDGTTVGKVLTREALPLDDYLRFKRVHRVFPKLSGSGQVKVWVGARSTFEEPTTWKSNDFTIGTDAWVDFRVTGRIIDIRFESTDQFRLHGFDLEYEAAGLY